jgi:hypothetical protein
VENIVNHFLVVALETKCIAPHGFASLVAEIKVQANNLNE